MEYCIEFTTVYEDVAAVHDSLYSYNLTRTGAERVDVHAERKENQMALVIRGADGKVYGGIVWHIVYDPAPIHVAADYFFIDDRFRGQGKGAELIGKMEDWAREHGAEYVSLGTNTFQAPVFYAKMGYTEIGRVPAPTPALPDNERYSFRKNIK